MLISNKVLSQIYPVQLTTQLIPPYSGYIADYADPGNDKLKIILQFNDFTKSQYDVKLPFVIKGNGFVISSKTTNNQQPITLIPGVPFLLSGPDLAPFLDSKNLIFSGISQAEYEKRKSLPEGFYSICVTAYDFFNPQQIQVSNEACASAWFTLSDPPLLNFPSCKSTIKPAFPQQLVFQWTPMNMGSPNSAMNTEYVFELFEIRPAGTDPNLIVQSMPPVFSVVTDFPMLNYGITEPALMEGMQYAWRVQARDKSGRDLFKNNGYSQMCSFLYGNILPEIKIQFNAQATTHRQAKTWWTCNAAYDSFIVQVRKPGFEHWFDFPCTGNEQKINDLESDMVYEARVRGSGPSDPSRASGSDGDIPWSNVVQFKTNPLPNYNCNDTYVPMDILPSGKPLLSAAPGIIVKAGQFEMLVTSIYPTGPPGWYGGFGKMPLIAGINVKVQFKNIFIDDNHSLQAGEILAVTDGIDKWVEQWEKHKFDHVAIYIKNVDSIFVKNDTVWIILPGGGLTPYTFPPGGGPVVIRDGDGNEYIIHPDGTITTRVYYTFSSDVLDASDSNKVVFEVSSQQKFGFDAFKYPPWSDDYEIIKLKKGIYAVPYKSVGSNSSDVVLARVTVPSFSKDKLKFISSSGSEISFKAPSAPSSASGAALFELTVPSSSKTIYAVYNGKKLGKLNVTELKVIERKLVLVPLPSGEGSGEGPWAESLRSAFSQANVKWNVKTAPVFSDNSWDLNKDGKLESSDATLMNKYSDEMRALRDAYRKKDSLFDKDAYYIFLVPEFSDGKQDGYMPRGKAVGFVAPNGLTPGPSPIGEGRNVPHELGHGAFGLEHTFPTLEQGTTDNLMDYGKGTHLTHKQWILIQQGVPVLSWFDDEEDALSVAGKLCKDFDVGGKYFIAPNGKVFTLPAGARITAGCSDIEGVPGGFTINSKQYLAKYSMIDQPAGSFQGYKYYSEAYPLTYTSKASLVHSVFVEDKIVKVYKSGEYEASHEAESYSLKGTVNNEHIFLNGGLKGELQCAFSVGDGKVKSETDKYLLLLTEKLKRAGLAGSIYICENGKLISSTPEGGVKTTPCTGLADIRKNIEEGNFSGDVAVLFEKDPNGGYNVKTGFNKNVNAAYGNSADVKKQSAAVLDKRLNGLLEKVNDLTLPDGAKSSGFFTEGKKIEVKSLPFFEKVVKIIESGKDILVKAKIPEQTWDGENVEYTQCWLKLPSLAAGLGDGVLEEIKDIPVLVAYGADLVVSQKSRDKLVAGLKNLSWDTIKSGLAKSGKEWVNTYQNGGDKAFHQGGKDAVVVFSLVIGGAKMLLEKAKDGIENSAGEVAENLVRRADDVFDVSKFAHLLKTEPNTAFFWSGKTNGVGGELRALEIAKNKNGITLEDILRKNNIKLPDFDATNPYIVKIWQDVSEEYAKQVSGEVRAVIGKDIRTNSVWETIELVALKSNPKVAKITTIDPETLLETIIFER